MVCNTVLYFIESPISVYNVSLVFGFHQFYILSFFFFVSYELRESMSEWKLYGDGGWLDWFDVNEIQTILIIGVIWRKLFGAKINNNNGNYSTKSVSYTHLDVYKRQKYYHINKGILFGKTALNKETWKVIIPNHIEKEIIIDYHIRYGHMGALKVIQAVSYTHLDVYKRQNLNVTICITFCFR